MAAAPSAVVPAAGSATLVRDIDTTGGSTPRELTAFLGRVAFSASDDGHGRELWITTTTSARRLRDIAPGSASSTPRDLTVVGSTLFFTADDGVHGRELWKSDGTNAGTRMVKDIRQGSRGSGPRGLMRFDGKVFLGANDGIHGAELWKSDGTRVGTKLVKEIAAGTSPSGVFPAAGAVMGDRLYFPASRRYSELWRTDGTAAGTSRIRAQLLIDGSIVATASRLYFLGIHDDGGCALPDPSFYASDGTSGGTHTIDVPTPLGTIVIWKGKAWFGANGFEPNRRLYRSAGTDATTAKVQPKVALDEFQPIQRSNGRLFLPQDGALAISDGTGAGTHLLGEPSLGWRARVEVVALGDTWYFPAGIASERELWQSDGSEAGTVPAADVNAGGSAAIASLVATGGAVWFSADDGTHGRELYRYEP